MCIDRGCCYKEGASPSCFYPNVGMANITKVHVIHGCHFDAGYVDTTVNIINRYFDEIFPRVFSVRTRFWNTTSRKANSMKRRVQTLKCVLLHNLG